MHVVCADIERDSAQLDGVIVGHAERRKGAMPPGVRRAVGLAELVDAEVWETGHHTE